MTQKWCETKPAHARPLWKGRRMCFPSRENKNKGKYQFAFSEQDFQKLFFLYYFILFSWRFCYWNSTETPLFIRQMMSPNKERLHWKRRQENAIPLLGAPAHCSIQLARLKTTEELQLSECQVVTTALGTDSKFIQILSNFPVFLFFIRHFIWLRIGIIHIQNWWAWLTYNGKWPQWLWGITWDICSNGLAATGCAILLFFVLVSHHFMCLNCFLNSAVNSSREERIIYTLHS